MTVSSALSWADGSPDKVLLFGRKDSEPFGGTLISITANSGPRDTPLAAYLIHRYVDTPEIDTPAQCLMLYSAVVLSPGAAWRTPTLLVLPRGHNGGSRCLFVRINGAPVLSSGHVSECQPPPTLHTIPSTTEWFSQSYPCGASSRAFKTAMTLPRWAPEFFSRPMMMMSPPCLRSQNQEGREFARKAVLTSAPGKDGTEVLVKGVTAEAQCDADKDLNVVLLLWRLGFSGRQMSLCICCRDHSQV